MWLVAHLKDWLVRLGLYGADFNLSPELLFRHPYSKVAVGFGHKFEAEGLPRFLPVLAIYRLALPALQSLYSAASLGGKQEMSFSNNEGSFNQFNVHLQDERSEILAWLSPLEQWIRDREVQSCLVPGVGDWLLHTEVFRSWSDVSPHEPNNATLFCYGDSGVGKTCIT